jgi:hypothetical protein
MSFVFSALRPMGVVARDILNILADSLRIECRQPCIKKSKGNRHKTRAGVQPKK